MSLRTRLLLAQIPLVLALVVTAVVGSLATGELRRSGQMILQNNYRSVLAAQRMKEAVERLDSAAVFLVLGRQDLGLQQAQVYRARFEDELQVQESNITETGETEATGRLRALWTEYDGTLRRFEQLPEMERNPTAYFRDMLPPFLKVKDAADAVLAINQDAMVRKSDQAERSARRLDAVILLAAFVGCLVALLVSTMLTARWLRPLSVLGQTARRIGQGDLAVRARVEGGGEIALLANEFNTMADHLQSYRRSSLGELLEAQHSAQDALDTLTDPVMILDLEGHLVQSNKAADAMLGVRADLSTAPLSLLQPDVRAAVERVRDHVLAGNGAYVPKGVQEAVRVLGSVEMTVLPRATPRYGEDGSIRGVTIVLQDVTRVMRLDELKNNLVATVAHEFRTPLTSLRMAIHLCVEQTVGPLTAKQEELLHAAREDCERLQTIVDELLDVSRLEAGRLTLSRRPVDVGRLVADSLEAERSPAAAKGVKLESQVLPGAGVLEADPERLKIVLSNLLVNAIRYSPQAGAVTLRAEEKDGDVLLTVTDEGPGIPAEYQQAIFEKYFQIPGETGGAGLGLFIAREIVAAHGGRLTVASAPGTGSTFSVRIPRQPAATA